MINKYPCKTGNCNCFINSTVHQFRTTDNFRAWQANGICQNCQDEIIEMQKDSPNPSRLDDPAVVLMLLPKPKVTYERGYSPTCYICADPEYAAMGMPLCKVCLDPNCGAHAAADDNGHDQYELWMETQDGGNCMTTDDGVSVIIGTDPTTGDLAMVMSQGVTAAVLSPDDLAKLIVGATSIEDHSVLSEHYPSAPMADLGRSDIELIAYGDPADGDHSGSWPHN